VSDYYIWRRATRCGESGQCVEFGVPHIQPVAPPWHKSSYSSDTANCVEVAEGMVQVAVRDSKDPDGPVLRFPGGAWREFVVGVKADLFTLR
jgi:hypothetical protein